jgi:phenylacetate-coenzyme A ligase PaaK-like adenylate-forming protein
VVFDAVETLPPARLRAHQWQRFTAMARELDANPFYRGKWAAAGLQAVDDLRGWDDFARLPFTRKAELVVRQRTAPSART